MVEKNINPCRINWKPKYEVWKLVLLYKIETDKVGIKNGTHLAMEELVALGWEKHKENKDERLKLLQTK